MVPISDGDTHMQWGEFTQGLESVEPRFVSRPDGHRFRLGASVYDAVRDDLDDITRSRRLVLRRRREVFRRRGLDELYGALEYGVVYSGQVRAISITLRVEHDDERRTFHALLLLLSLSLVLGSWLLVVVYYELYLGRDSLLVNIGG